MAGKANRVYRRRFDMRFGNRSSDCDAALLLDAVQNAGEENMSRFTKDVLAALYLLWQQRGGELPLTREGILAFLEVHGTTPAATTISPSPSPKRSRAKTPRANIGGLAKSKVVFSTPKTNAETVARNFLSSMKGMASGFFD